MRFGSIVSAPVTHQTSSALESMLKEVERTTAATLNATQAVANAVKQAIREGADPHILAGALVDGIATVALAGIAEEDRCDVASDLLLLLYARLDALDMIQQHEKPQAP